MPPYPGPAPEIGKALDNVFVKLDHRTINLHGLTTTSTIQEVYDKLKAETKISQANTGLIFGSKELKPGLGELLADCLLILHPYAQIRLTIITLELRDVDIGNVSP